jgi:hypothetical protein
MRLWWQFEGKIALRADYRRRALPDDANAVRWREKVCEEGLVGVARQPALISRAPRIVMGAFLGPSTVLPVTGAQRLKRVEPGANRQCLGDCLEGENQCPLIA